MRTQPVFPLKMNAIIPVAQCLLRMLGRAGSLGRAREAVWDQGLVGEIGYAGRLGGLGIGLEAGWGVGEGGISI